MNNSNISKFRYNFSTQTDISNDTNNVLFSDVVSDAARALNGYSTDTITQYIAMELKFWANTATTSAIMNVQDPMTLVVNVDTAYCKLLSDSTGTAIVGFAQRDPTFLIAGTSYTPIRFTGPPVIVMPTVDVYSFMNSGLLFGFSFDGIGENGIGTGIAFVGMEVTEYVVL